MITNDPQALILRHRRENLRKCSLKGLETRQELSFHRYPHTSSPMIDGMIYLSLEGEELTIRDRGRTLFLIDATWRYQQKIEALYSQQLSSCIRRTLPKSIKTAYPRRQEDCPDKERGLASCEALFAAFKILGYEADFLLEHYHFKQQFLLINGYT